MRQPTKNVQSLAPSLLRNAAGARLSLLDLTPDVERGPGKGLDPSA
jgi:hypothetical protein